MSNRATSAHNGTVDLVAVLGPWSDGPGPLYQELRRAIGDAIERGVLADGDRLPSERDAARVLAIGRGTAVAAYEHLVADGLLERRRGSGTYVRVTDQPPLPPGREGSALVHRLVEHGSGAADLVDLSISVLAGAEGVPDVSVSTSDLLAVVPDTGYAPRGLPSLRSAVAEHITGWGLPTDPGQVVITTGAQQAISAAAACWVRPGDTVVVDDPTYPGALAAFTQAGAVIAGAPVDGHGVRPEAVAALLALRPSLVYLQSSVHSPTGTLLSADRRAEIAGLLAAARVPLVEDVALADLSWEDPPPPIASHDPGAPIAVVGSFSKLFWGGLRVGFVRAPEPLALRFARVKATHDLGTSAVGQLVTERMLRSAPASELRSFRTAELHERYEVLAGALGRALPAWRWRRPSGGLSLWVDIGEPSEPFAQHALRHGVAVATPGALSPSTAHDTHLRLSFAGRPEVLVEGVARLAAAAAAWSRAR